MAKGWHAFGSKAFGFAKKEGSKLHALISVSRPRLAVILRGKEYVSRRLGGLSSRVLSIKVLTLFLGALES
jgi:hypothetical protein